MPDARPQLPLDLIAATLGDIVNALAVGTVTSVELVEAYLDNIERDNLQGKELRAVSSHLDRELAISIASKLDEERSRGYLRSALHGVPIGVKGHLGTGPELGRREKFGVADERSVVTDVDLNMPTHAGIKALEHAHCRKDSAIIARLRQQGCIILAKTNMTIYHQLFCKDHSIIGPWNQIMTPARGVYGQDVGGTSFGCATGLSSGMFAAAIGGKTAGSIVRPSTLAGLYALEPSVGLVNDIEAGNLGVSPDWDALGPMGKSSEDVALLMDVLVAKGDRGELSYIEAMNRVRLDRDRKFRIAVHDPDRVRRDAADGDLRSRAFDAAVKRLSQHPQIELVQSLTPVADSVNQIAGLKSRLPFYQAFQTQLDVDAYNSLTAFMAEIRGSDVHSVEELLQWQKDHPDVSEIPGIPDMYWHIQRMVELRGDRSHPEYIAASELVSKTKSEILAFMADNRLDAVLGDLQLSLMASYSNSAYGCVPVGMHSDSREPQALCIMGRPFGEQDLIHIMSLAEEVFGKRPLPPDYEHAFAISHNEGDLGGSAAGA